MYNIVFYLFYRLQTQGKEMNALQRADYEAGLRDEKQRKSDYLSEIADKHYEKFLRLMPIDTGDEVYTFGKIIDELMMFFQDDNSKKQQARAVQFCTLLGALFLNKEKGQIAVSDSLEDLHSFLKDYIKDDLCMRAAKHEFSENVSASLEIGCL